MSRDLPPHQRPGGPGINRSEEGRELWGGSHRRLTRRERGLEST